MLVLNFIAIIVLLYDNKTIIVNLKMENNNNLKKWLDENLNHRQYMEMIGQAHKVMGVTAPIIYRDFKGHFIPTLRKKEWVRFMQRYNENVTFEDLFPSELTQMQTV